MCEAAAEEKARPTEATSRVTEFLPGLGQGLLVTFACWFPLVTRAHQFDSRYARFYALSAFAVLIGACLFQRIRKLECPLRAGPPTRLGLAIWGILSVYAALLLGPRVEALLIPVVFFFILQVVLRQNSLAGRCPGRVLLLLLLLGAVMIVSSFATPYQYIALAGGHAFRTGLATFGCCVLVFLAVVFFLSDSARYQRAVKWMLAGGVITACIGLAQFFFQDGFAPVMFPDLIHDIRPRATMGHPNWHGTYLLLLFPLAVYQLFKKPRLLQGVVCGLVYANIVIAQTRGAWIATAVFLGLLFVCRPEHRRHTLRLCLLLLFITAFLAPWNDWQILKRAETLQRQAGLVMEGSPVTGSGRFGYWKYALERLPRHAILGSGLDTLAEIAPPGTTAPSPKAHSIYLDYAVTIGIPGLLLYLAFLWACASGSSRCFLRWTFRAAILAYFVQGIFIHDTIHTWPMLWFVAGLAVVASREGSPIREGGMTAST